MPWNSTSPNGSLSVKANRTPMQQNTTYIETTMGNDVVGTNAVTTRDHFWNVGSDEDGRHRFIQSVGFTVGGTPTDPVIGTGMDGVIYLKEDGLTPARVQGFYQNASGVYQFIPALLSGTIEIPNTGSYTNIVTVPNNSYGEIFMWVSGSSENFGSFGAFRAIGGLAQAWAFDLGTDSSSSVLPLKYGNGSSASGLNIRARRSDASSHTWTYRIKYWAM